MYSQYLKKEIDFTEVYASSQYGKKIPIVYHSELESFILNDLRGKVHFDFPVIIPSPTDAVVTCSMWDSNQKITAIGEATPKTLSSGVSENFPVTTASIRAFDRAAIRFLGLGNVHSDQEIAPDGPKNYSHNKCVDAPSTERPGDKVDESSGTPPVEQASEQPQNNTPPTKDISQEDGLVLITMGRKYSAQPKSIEAIYKENPGYLEFLSRTIKTKKPEFIAQLEAIKRYLDSHQSSEKEGA